MTARSLRHSLTLCDVKAATALRILFSIPVIFFLFAFQLCMRGLFNIAWALLQGQSCAITVLFFFSSLLSSTGFTPSGFMANGLAYFFDG